MSLTAKNFRGQNTSRATLKPPQQHHHHLLGCPKERGTVLSVAARVPGGYQDSGEGDYLKNNGKELSTATP